MMKIFKNFWKPDGLKNASPPVNTEAKFTLWYNKLPMGELNIYNGVWMFKYSDQFKNQDEVAKLIDFPDVEKVYKSKELWPLFVSRIPSMSQPAIKKIVDEEKIDPQNEIALLQRFGMKTIQNPFKLAVNL